MASLIPRLLVTAAIASRLVAGGPTIGLCRDKPCQDCPTQIEIQETDNYPFCGYWNATELITNHTGFAAAEDGGWMPMLQIPQPGPDCRIIVRKSTTTGARGCGIPIGAFHHAVCFPLPLYDLFMVQYCCGDQDCLHTEAPEERKKMKKPSPFSPNPKDPRNILETRGRSREKCDKYGRKLRPQPMMYNGGKWPPAVKQVPGRVTTEWQRRPLSVTNWERLEGEDSPSTGCWDRRAWPPKVGQRRPPRVPAIKGRGGRHDRYARPDYPQNMIPGSWRILRNYTKPSTLTSIVSNAFDGTGKGGSVSISVSRTDGWSTTTTWSLGASVGGITKPGAGANPGQGGGGEGGGAALSRRDGGPNLGFSWGWSRNHGYSCSVSDSRTVSANIGTSRSGYMGFTAFHHCEIGFYRTCEGTWKGPHEACFPYKNGLDVSGMYEVVSGI